MSIQHMFHIAVQHNDFDLCLKSIKRSLPLFFDYIMQSYARSGSCYLDRLSSLEANYPDLKDQLSKTEL